MVSLIAMIGGERSFRIGIDLKNFVEKSELDVWGN